MTFLEWLRETTPLGGTIADRLAELYAMNGRSLLAVNCGSLIGVGAYGRERLNQAEVLELVHLSGVVAGFALAEGGESIGKAFKLEVVSRIPKPSAGGSRDG